MFKGLNIDLNEFAQQAFQNRPRTYATGPSKPMAEQAILDLQGPAEY
jgi:hypothetical protein